LDLLEASGTKAENDDGCYPTKKEWLTKILWSIMNLEIQENIIL
jgi:hypothetical protein